MHSVQSIRPDPRLEPFIQWYVHREWQLGEGEIVEPVVARSGTMIEFQFDDPYYVLPNRLSRAVTIVGPMNSRKYTLVIRGHVEAFAVLFRPLGFFRLFGVPVSPLAGDGTEAHSVLGLQASALYERMGNTPGFGDRVDLLNSFFLRRLRISAPILPNGHALRMLACSPQATSVADMARLAGISQRQLERQSLEYTGLSPKTLVKLARFQRALRMKTTHNMSWMEVAHATNYHDQMHLIHDFHSLAGNTPNQIIQQITPDHLISFLCH